jgi:hypothetical protein
VILADEGSEVGGSLLGDRAQINRDDATRWVQEVATELKSTPGVRVLVRSQVAAIWDHDMATVVEQVGSGAPVAHRPAAHLPRQRLWKIRAREIVIATGAIERAIAFGDNDLPGVMLAGSARTYLNRHGVQPGRRAVVFTNNDSAYHAALDLHRSGVEVGAIIDVRPEPSGSAFEAAVAAGIRVHAGHGVLRTLGGHTLRAALVAPIDASGRATSDARGTAFPDRRRCAARLGWLESRGPPVVAGTRQAEVRRRTGHLRARPGEPAARAHPLRRQCRRRLPARRLRGAGAGRRPSGGQRCRPGPQPDDVPADDRSANRPVRCCLCGRSSIRRRTATSVSSTCRTT